MRAVLIVSGLTLALAGCQTTGGTRTHNLVAVAGKPLKLASARSINPDCSSIGSVTIRVINGPVNGTTSIKQGADFPTYARGNLRSACNMRRVLSDQLWYVSNKPGTNDQVTAEYIFPTGVAGTYTYNIQVR